MKEINNKTINDVLSPKGWEWLLGLLPFIIILLIALSVYYVSKHPSSSDVIYPDENPGEQYCGPGGSTCY